MTCDCRHQCHNYMCFCQKCQEHEDSCKCSSSHYNEAEHQKVSAGVKAAWKDVPDIVAWVEGLRGNTVQASEQERCRETEVTNATSRQKGYFTASRERLENECEFRKLEQQQAISNPKGCTDRSGKTPGSTQSRRETLAS